MNIVLIGYRGTGKSVIGRRLANRLNMKCVSMDAAIVDRAEMSIPEFVEQNGWPAFRDLETVIAQELAELDGLVVDTGGGVIERPENIEALKKNGTIVWLKASVEAIVRRIEKGTQRPALTEGKTFTEEVAEVLERRTPLYAGAADHEIDTDPVTPKQVAQMIVELCGEE